MKTEARNLGAGFLARLEQREMIRNLDLFTVNFQLCHCLNFSPVCLMPPSLAAIPGSNFARV